MGIDNVNLRSSSLSAPKSERRSEKMHQEDTVNRKKEAQHREFNNIELVNNSFITDVLTFPPSRQTRWDQYNQVRLNETSIRKLQKSLDAQDHMHQSFLEHYKPNNNFHASFPRANDQQKSSRNRFKRGKSALIFLQIFLLLRTKQHHLYNHPSPPILPLLQAPYLSLQLQQSPYP